MPRGREAVTYRETWPHEYVVSGKDGQQELLAAFCERIRRGEGVTCRFFHQTREYLFLGDHKYWTMTECAEMDVENGDYVLNRGALLPRPARFRDPERRHRQARVAEHAVWVPRSLRRGGHCRLPRPLDRHRPRRRRSRTPTTESPMFAQQTLMQFDHIVTGCRATLEAVPDDRLDWRPHEKSWTLGELATPRRDAPPTGP